MKLVQPPYWRKNAAKPLYWILLWLISGMYYLGTLIHRFFGKKHPLPHLSICVGNAVAGGSGKTPTLIALARLLGEDKIVFLTRGYGGSEKGPVWVEDRHSADDVGDEALLLARHAPTLVCADRIQGADLAKNQFPDRIIILDDGMQNPHFRASLNLLVWDSFESGNGHMIPAGPLRLPLSRTLKRTDLVITLDNVTPPKLPAFSAHGFIETDLEAQEVVAFAGIGRPKKFKLSLKKSGFKVAEFHAFGDHHPYTEDEIGALLHDTLPTVTTEKDHVRLPAAFKNRITAIPYVVHFSHPQALRSWLLDNLK